MLDQAILDCIKIIDLIISIFMKLFNLNFGLKKSCS